MLNLRVWRNCPSTRRDSRPAARSIEPEFVPGQRSGHASLRMAVHMAPGYKNLGFYQRSATGMRAIYGSMGLLHSTSQNSYAMPTLGSRTITACSGIRLCTG
jgi:hypothetical protein